MRVMAASPPRLVVRGAAALPIPPFFRWGHGLLAPARLSFRAAYQTYLVDLFNFRAVASSHRRTIRWRACAGWRLLSKRVPIWDAFFVTCPLTGRKCWGPPHGELAGIGSNEKKPPLLTWGTAASIIFPDCFFITAPPPAFWGNFTTQFSSYFPLSFLLLSFSSQVSLQYAVKR